RDFHVTGVQTCALPISEDAILADLRDQAQRAAGEQQLAQRALTLEQSHGAALGEEADLAALEARRAEIDELSSIAPDSDVLANETGRAPCRERGGAMPG